MLDNYERLATLVKQVEYLEDLAVDSSDEQTSIINELAQSVDLSGLLGLPITLTGGEVEVTSIDRDLSPVKDFRKNHQPLSGVFSGLNWREVLVDPEIQGLGQLSIRRICYAIATGGESKYYDFDGSIVTRTPITYVTVGGSTVKIDGVMGSHDKKELEGDGFSTDLDNIIYSEADANDQANVIAKMFTYANEDKKTLMQQRISYLNSLEFFEGKAIFMPYAFCRSQTDNTTRILSLSGSDSVVQVDYVSMDHALDKDGNFIDESGLLMTLSYEFELPGWGRVSGPHIIGKTKILEIV